MREQSDSQTMSGGRSTGAVKSAWMPFGNEEAWREYFYVATLAG